MDHAVNAQPSPDRATTGTSRSDFDRIVQESGITDGAGTPVEQQARMELEILASEPGNSALKLRLAQEGISLTDHSDVGANERFESFGEKLFHVTRLKLALLMAITMSMATSGGWGPGGTDADVEKARSAMRGG